MTDPEVICEFMERRPKLALLSFSHTLRSQNLWWALWPNGDEGTKWLPCDLTLDRLYHVEESLSAAEWRFYDAYLLAMHSDSEAGEVRRALVHLPSAVKSEALAATIRAFQVSEGGNDGK